MFSYQFEFDAIDSQNFISMLQNSINRYGPLIMKEMVRNDNREENPYIEAYEQAQAYEQELLDTVIKGIKNG